MFAFAILHRLRLWMECVEAIAFIEVDGKVRCLTTSHYLGLLYNFDNDADFAGFLISQKDEIHKEYGFPVG